MVSDNSGSSRSTAWLYAGIGLVCIVGGAVWTYKSMQAQKRLVEDHAGKRNVQQKQDENVVQVGQVDGEKNELVQRLLTDPRLAEAVAGKSGMEQLRKVWQDVMQKALWDHVKDDIENGKYERLLSLIEELKMKLNGITPNRRDLVQEMNQALDIEFLKQQLEHHEPKEWDLFALTSLVIARIRALEAPARNTVTDGWWNEYKSRLANPDKTLDDVIGLLREFFDFAHEKIDLIISDTRDFIRSITPERNPSQQLEAKIQEQFAKGEISLERTRAWFEMATRVYFSDPDLGGSPQSEQDQTDTRALGAIHRCGLVELIIPGGELQMEKADPYQNPFGDRLPETMEATMQILQANVLAEVLHAGQTIFRMAYAILRIRQLVPDASPQMLDELVEKVHGIDRIIVQTDPVGKKTTITKLGHESYQKLVATAVLGTVQKYHTLDQIEIDSLNALLIKAFVPEIGKDTTYAMISSRLRKLIKGLIIPSEEVRNQNMQDLQQQMAQLRLAPMAQALVKLAHTILTFAVKDIQVHTKVYYQLLKMKSLSATTE